MKLSELKKRIYVILADTIGEHEAEATRDVILQDIGGISRTDAVINPDRCVEPETAAKMLEGARRVANGEPVQYVVGKAFFNGLMLAVTPDVLIPRPETSMLVDVIVDDNRKKSDLKVLDVCTGSGAIAIALARRLHFAAIDAIDVSKGALKIAELNCRNLKIKNVSLSERDVLTDGLPNTTYDIVVSNPPYVLESERATIDNRVKLHEPEIALFVPDDDPLRFYRIIGKEAFSHLQPGGKLYFEINPLCASSLVKMLKDFGYESVEVYKYIDRAERFVTAVKP